MIGVANQRSTKEVTVGADLDTLATARYVKIDDELKMRPELARPRPEIGPCPKLSRRAPHLGRDPGPARLQL